MLFQRKIGETPIQRMERAPLFSKNNGDISFFFGKEWWSLEWLFWENTRKKIKIDRHVAIIFSKSVLTAQIKNKLVRHVFLNETCCWFWKRTFLQSFFGAEERKRSAFWGQKKGRRHRFFFKGSWRSKLEKNMQLPTCLARWNRHGLEEWKFLHVFGGDEIQTKYLNACVLGRLDFSIFLKRFDAPTWKKSTCFTKWNSSNFRRREIFQIFWR